MDGISRKDLVPYLRNRLFASSVYRWLLDRSQPCLPHPIDVAFAGDQRRGQSFRMANFIHRSPSSDQGNLADLRISDQFLWLPDLQASQLETSVSIAQEVTEDWIKRHLNWTSTAWQLDVLADRVCNWIASAPFILAGADPDFSALFTKALARHAKHLEVAVRFGEVVPHGLAIQKALIYCGIALEGHHHLLGSGLKMLQHSIDEEIYADGGHVSRNPYIQMMALRRMIEVRTVLENQSSGAPAWLQASIDKMTPMLRAFVMGDGQLARFNGAVPVDPTQIESVLKKSGANGRAVTNSPHSGFQRLATRRTVVVMDVGVPQVLASPSTENTGTLGFEMSVGKHLLIVNCGLPSDGNQTLQTALRGTSAHSTLSVEETNSSEITSQGFLGVRRAQRTQSLRREIDKNTLVEATHDGYIDLFQLSHKRSLYLSSGGNELRGEDVLSGPGEKTATVRFHLHPSVHASLVQAGDSILLKFGKSTGWRFRASVSELGLEPSIHYDANGRRQSQQIVLKTEHRGGETKIKWRLSKED